MRCSVQPQHEIAALELSRRLAPLLLCRRRLAVDKRTGLGRGVGLGNTSWAFYGPRSRLWTAGAGRPIPRSSSSTQRIPHSSQLSRSFSLAKKLSFPPADSRFRRPPSLPFADAAEEVPKLPSASTVVARVEWKAGDPSRLIPLSRYGSPNALCLGSESGFSFGVSLCFFHYEIIQS
jgi:hypothetical protein